MTFLITDVIIWGLTVLNIFILTKNSNESESFYESEAISSLESELGISMKFCLLYSATVIVNRLTKQINRT